MPSALAVFTCRPASHPFQERHVYLDESVKIGRSVARCRPSPNNATFDCKVLSRNHALLWFENDKFFLQDTKSSNGTFVNNQRLSKGSEESAPYEILSGDLIQFGVDVMENSRRVTHSCIISAVKLFLPDGAETRRRTEVSVSAMTLEKVSASQANAYSQELYQISQCLKEALHREQMLEQKLATLQRILTSTQEASESSWQALMDEDQLLSRLEVLEGQLLAHTKSQTEESLRKELTALLEDKLSYETTAKESLRRVLQEKLEVVRKLSDVERALSNTEDECSHLKEMFEKSQEEVLDLARCHTDAQDSIKELTDKLRASEEQHEEACARGGAERHELQAQLEALEQREGALQARVEALAADNDFTRQQLASVKARLEQIQEKSSLKEESASLDDRVDDLSSKINGSIDEEHVAPPGVDSCTELVQQIVQQQMKLGISNDSNPSLEEEMTELQAKLRALVEAAQRKQGPPGHDGVCVEPRPPGDGTISEQSGAVETLREELSRTRQQLCQANADIQSLKGRLEEHEAAACEETVSSCSSSSREDVGSAEGPAPASGEPGDTHAEPGATDSELQRLREQLSEALEAARASQEQRQHTQAAIQQEQESRATLDGCLKQIERLQELLLQAQQELSGLRLQQESERQEAWARLAQAERDNAAIQLHADATRAGQHGETAALQEDLRRAHEELGRLQADMERRRGDTAALRQQVEARSLAMEQQHQQETEQLRADVAEAQREGRAAVLEAGRLCTALGQQEEAMRSLQAQLAAQQQRGDLETELGHARECTHALLSQVEEVRAEAESWQHKFSMAQRQKEDLHAQISHFQSSLDESRRQAKQQSSWARIVPVMCLVVAVTLTMLYRPE